MHTHACVYRSKEDFFLLYSLKETRSLNELELSWQPANPTDLPVSTAYSAGLSACSALP